MQTYYTHDNGRRPFKVTVFDEPNANRRATLATVRIYEIFDDENRQQDQNANSIPSYARSPTSTLYAKRVFVGESPHNAMTEFSGSHGPAFRGNSLLVQLCCPGYKYVFIGHMVFAFRTEFEIQEFVSPVGNNDVPYPWARDSENNTYLMLDGSVLAPSCAWDDNNPYRYYYDHSLITKDLGSIPSCEPIGGAFHNIVGFKLGEENITMRTTAFPGKEYDRFITDPDWGTVTVIYNDGMLQQLTKVEYVRIIEEFNSMRGFSAFNRDVLIPRLW